MQRKARSRSDAPRLTEPSGTQSIIIGTVDSITAGTVVVGNGYIGAIIAIGTGVRISASIGGGAGCTLAPPWATR